MWARPAAPFPPLLKAFHGHMAMPIYTGWVGWEKSLVGWRSMATVGVARQVGLEPVVVVVVVMSVFARSGSPDINPPHT